MISFHIQRHLLMTCSQTKKYRPNTLLPSAAKCFGTSVGLRGKKDSDPIPKNTMEQHITAHSQPGFGKVYDKKPFKMHLQANKIYKWCCCGYSKNQPFCDGSHKNPYMKIPFRPVFFSVEEDKEYYLCNCKQTTRRPFCDGTHKKKEIQDQVKF